MRKLSPREIVLLVLLGVVGAFLLYLRPDGGIGTGGRGGLGEDLDLGEPPVVNLADLAGHTDAYDAQGRNLFQYYTPPAPVVERPKPPPIEPKVVVPPPQIVQRNPPPDPGPKPPAITVTYLGFLGPKENKIAVFEDGQELLLARAGDVVKNQFRVLDFGYETVVVGYVDKRFSDQTQELPQKAGSPGARSRGRR